MLIVFERKKESIIIIISIIISRKLVITFITHIHTLHNYSLFWYRNNKKGGLVSKTQLYD